MMLRNDKEAYYRLAGRGGGGGGGRQTAGDLHFDSWNEKNS